MENNITTNAFEEYVFKRCEEILSCDQKYQNLCNDILSLETEFKKTLSQNQIKEYNQIEGLNMESIIYAAVCVYNACISDIKHIKNS